MPQTKADRVRKVRNKLRAAGLRPIQVWIPDARAPGFVDEIRRQCRLIVAAEATPESREELDFWETLAADTWPFPDNAAR